ncbi:DUF6193 family natural product biosynthesis protein [Streptomyces sp. NPDC057099]|uniref:DUF6193 family natural product biosynthesis protein n=1 Tax=Streptomyces sp. NPDC057099 TaxID=3346019 RepID=UPI003626FE08
MPLRWSVRSSRVPWRTGSHWALRFSSTTRPRLTVVRSCLDADSGGTYWVGRGAGSQVLGRFGTAYEAVALTVRQLPSGLRPALP